MTVLYKMNKSGTISWWEIESSISDQEQPETNHGYRTWWGNDHKARTRQTENTQFTYQANRITMSVSEQIEAQISEMIVRKGYSRDIPTTSPELPMLAQTWASFVEKANSEGSKVEHFDSFYYQPKLDGIRCIATPNTLYSRRNLPFTSVPHIELALSTLKDDPEFAAIKLDGELYYHGADLQYIQSIVSKKQFDPFMYKEISYQVFDIVDTELTFEQRHVKLTKVIDRLAELWKYTNFPDNMHRHITPDCPVQLVDTAFLSEPTINAATIIQRMNTELVNFGYEGLIIRNPQGMYQPNYRSFDLIKYKEFADAEFLILDVVEAKNKLGTFLCQTMAGKRFKVAPAWTSERKRQILRYKDNYVGRLLTVKYEKLSNDGIPLKPIGVIVREGT
jgi:DNA ligase 1